ncbi:hypothetical protein [Caproiciproducens sp. CPB-2]|uniref:hypothetical protein n=1 Tax=Caproiciproducens sp. CPB-2 TaxID=3030017 RepID=UPI0023D9C023|nr:hypothetical protein [Caproiciproducens sp. CPB-2]MDF1496071.1 hypothetical protein [Caproiciproducens sp. CPB-2]
MESTTDRFWSSFQNNFSNLRIAIEEACEDLNSPGKKQKVFDSLNNTIHSLLDYWERVKKDSNISAETKKKMRAFAYANNKLKHEYDLVSIEDRKGGFSFPITFPLKIEKVRYKWSDLDYIHRESSNQKNDFQQYCRFLKQKEIISSLEDISSLIGPDSKDK